MSHLHSIDALDDNAYAFISRLVKEKTGIVLSGERHRNMVHGRLIRRLRSLNIPSFNAYCALLKEDNEEEIVYLINSITTNVTAFFREPHHFVHLKEYLTRRTENNEESHRIRLWSAACSSGEEVYSMAMTAMEAIKNLAAWDMKILATDIDTGTLAKGVEARYSATIKEALPAGYAKKYTVPVNEKTVEMAEDIRRLVTFKCLNLLHDWPVKGPFDAIFCRNVFIYFTAETQHSIAERFIRLLRPGGFLYIGHSENLLHMDGKLKNIGKTIYQKV